MKFFYTITDKSFKEKNVKLFLRKLNQEQLDQLEDWMTDVYCEKNEEEEMDLVYTNGKLTAADSNTTNSLVPLSYGTTPEPKPWKETALGKVLKKEKEKKMYNLDIDCGCNSAPANPELVAKDYLVGRLLSARDVKASAAYKTFGLETDDRPITPKELVDRITSGKFVINTDKSDYRTHYPMDFIEWRDPAIKKDRPGYEAWEKLLGTAYYAAKDQIMIGTPADGLKALQTFEVQTIQ